MNDRDVQFERDALTCLPDVARFARSLTRNESAADDLVQETFLRAYRGYASFRPGSDVRRWLFSICHHAFLRIQEREQRVVLSSDGGDAELETMGAVMSHVAAQRTGLDAYVCSIDVGPAIHEAIEHLAAPYRLAVTLVDVEGLSYEEAAEVAEVPVGTIRSRLFRARRLLQDQLFEYAQDLGVTSAAPTTTMDSTTSIRSEP
ncbi:MAG: sigma-70 family RNA polymerase sigma factor [Gemmatimonadota bacterium]|nr:sigma-70 family RNA polymerase sigma factor [Gemmatimonadota bacterium]MDQ8173840.1 sigma-70 family RNA polymerase sigma factor [Gemmatimonadota bacterium]